MFPHPDEFHPAADMVIEGVAFIAKFYRNDHSLTRRWRSPKSPGIRCDAWARRMESVQHLRTRIETRIDLTELSSLGLDDGLPSRQQARLIGMRDVAAQAANTIRRILRTCEVENREELWELVDKLEFAADQLEALAFGEAYVTR